MKKYKQISVASSAPLTGSSTPFKGLFSGTKEKFVMPTEAPSKDKWVPDSATSVCMVCQEETFSMVRQIKSHAEIVDQHFLVCMKTKGITICWSVVDTL